MNNSGDENSNIQNDDSIHNSMNNDIDNPADTNLEDGSQEEERPKEPQNPLKLDTIKKSLRNLSKTYNGLSYAYTKIDLKDKELDDIGEDLGNYIHLRDLDLSQNKFTQINSVINMSYLVRLDGSKNEINTMSVFTFSEKLQFLQILNLKENKIKELPELTTNSLTELYLDSNSIKDCSNFKGLPLLQKLSMNQNKLSSCNGMINMPNLEMLYLNENEIKNFGGLRNLIKLRKLRLKANRLEVFEEVPELPNLEKLNLSENQINKFAEFSHLNFLKLKKINVESNPCFDGPNAGAKIEILIQLEDLQIKAVNKDEVAPEDRQEALRVKEERIQKDREEAEDKERQRINEENERKIREEEERLEKEREEKERIEKEDEERKEREEEERKIKQAEEEKKRDEDNQQQDEINNNDDDENNEDDGY